MSSGDCISIVIPTFNAGPLFEQSLQAIRAQKTSRRVEIVAVDSGSTDGTIDRLRQAHEDADDLRQPVDLAMRDGDTAAETGRAQLLALDQHIGQDLGVLPRRTGGGRRQGLEQQFLVGRRNAGQHRIVAQQVAEIIHARFPMRPRAGRANSGPRGRTIGAYPSEPPRCGSTQPMVPSPRR